MSSLSTLDFFDSDGEPIDGLVAVRRPGDGKSPHEQFVLRQAQDFEIIDFVFFRRFEDRNGRHIRSSQVLAYVIDNSRQRHTKEQLVTLHHKLWLQGLAPLIYVAWPTSIDILSCARKPDFWNETTGELRYLEADSVEVPPDDELISSLNVAADISDAINKRKRLSASRLLDGTFWEDHDNQKLAREEATAHKVLIKAIVEADAEVDGANNPVRRRLLLLMVLIAYLEDRGVFPPGHFGRYHAGVRSFRELLQVGTVDEVTSLLRYLEKTKFNGDVFSLSHDGASLSESDLKRFANLVDGKTLGKQKHFWKLFDFQHIPVEVISRLYQRFVTTDSAVYTPPLLASLILDQVMPYDRLTGREKVLDPSCGSGIFLVGAFKRLVIHWRSRHRWQRPSVEDVKSILMQSIHGVEMEQAAVDLSAFSLALALCDALDPPVIWSQLKFERLGGRNLRKGDYFDAATLASTDEHQWPKEFNIVVGNPPFESKLTVAGKVNAKTRPKDYPRIPDSNAAYYFLERGLQSLSKNGNGALCLIQPSNLLYGSNTADFRSHLMQLARLETVLDFVSVRGLYDGADPKTVVWHAINEPINDSSINHLTFRRTYATAERICFELDHYDSHSVLRSDAEKDPFVWRVGLLGGGRLLEVSQRLRRLPTLEEFVGAKGWEYGEGFIVGNEANEAEWLTGLPYLPTKEFVEDTIDSDRLTSVVEKYFEAPRTEDLFSPPLILIKEHASLPVAFWNQGSLAFRHSIVAIHSDPKEGDDLKTLYRLLQSRKRLYQFNCLLNGNRAFVSKATAILKDDIDRLPLPNDPAELDFAFWEEALQDDVLNYMAEFVRLGQKSVLLKKSATVDEVGEYESLYVRMLGSVYHNLKAAESVRFNGLIAQPFYFGKKPEVNWLQEGNSDALQRLIYDNSRDALRVIRVVRYYENNVILIVKPDRLRYWIPSTAIRDADDTLIDLRQQGW